MINIEDEESRIADQFYKLQDSSCESSSDSTQSDVNLNPFIQGLVQQHFGPDGGKQKNCFYNMYLQIMKWKEMLIHAYEKETLLVEVAVAIIFAYYLPELGQNYLHPEITAHWIAVIIIFCK